MKLRKLLIVLLALLVVFSFAGCGGGGGGSDDPAGDNGGTNGDNGGNGGNGGSGGGDNGGGSGGNGDSGSDEDIPADFVRVNGGTIDGDGDVEYSSIFIDGRSVNIRDMYVCIHEVTQKEFKQYMKLYVWTSDIGVSHSSETQGSSGMGDNYPVFWTSWYSAVMYCNLRSIAEGLTPVYYIEINGKNETDVAKWLTALGPELDRASDDYQCFNCEDGKYYYNGSQTNGRSQPLLDYTGSSDLNGGIQFDTSANGYRLPTEVEWEYLARGGLSNNGMFPEQTTYAGSDDPAGYVVGDGSTTANGAEIKTKLPNALGIYDMSGNAYEWVWDWYDNIISASTPDTGPEKPAAGNGRVKRGGSHNNNIVFSQVDNRVNGIQGYANDGAGFRVVRNAD